jgi:SAM-dependent methyltransferase
VGEYEASTYGERWAQIYDEWVGRVPGVPGPEQVVPVLAGLAGTGPALELAIGTGRIALPLSARGVEVHGVDASEAMVARLRAKPGGADIPVTKGDFADVPVEGRYRLVFVVFNTFFALLSQDDQVRCFANVADHLTDDGAFVIEAFVPDLTMYHRGQRVHATEIHDGELHLDAGRLDVAAQRVSSMRVILREGNLTLLPIEIRYAWPSELDLMARLAGLRLRDRWGGWQGEPFTAESGRHVSVYERAS